MVRSDKVRDPSVSFASEIRDIRRVQANDGIAANASGKALSSDVLPDQAYTYRHSKLFVPEEISHLPDDFSSSRCDTPRMLKGIDPGGSCSSAPPTRLRNSYPYPFLVSRTKLTDVVDDLHQRETDP